MDSHSRTSDRRGLAFAWAAAWLVAAVVIAAVGYESRDPDSQLYAGMSARLTSQPVERWIVLEWWGFWNSTGPYFEHPAGMFVVPAAFARLGYPAQQSAYAINALYQVIVFFLAASLSAAVLPRQQAHALGWILQLLPIAFVFRVRANQEYALLAGFVFALYATERARSRPLWIVGMLAGFCAVLLVKGVFAFMLVPTCALWLVARHGPPEAGARHWVAWAGIVLMPVVAMLVTWAYEAAYVQAAGRSFLESYQRRQLPENALTSGTLVGRTAYTATWYATRVIWYAFPWSLMALAVAIRGVREKLWWPSSSIRAPTAIGETATVRQGAWFGLVAAFVLTVAFSLAHRKADRYLFPVYFLVGAVGGVAAIRRFPRMQRVVRQLDRPWVPGVLYIVLLLVALLARGRLPVLTFWRT